MCHLSVLAGGENLWCGDGAGAFPYDKEKLSESSNRNKLIKDIQNGKIGQDLVKQELSKTKNANMNDIYAKVADKLIKNKQVSVKPKSEFDIWKQDIDSKNDADLYNYLEKLYNNINDTKDYQD